MGKILSKFNNGYAGAISRSIDNVVTAFANGHTDAIGFGMPVALNSDGTGVVPFDGSTHTADQFLGITVRNPSKTPDAYGSNAATYNKGEIVDVLVRGSIVVECVTGTPVIGGAAAIKKSTGEFAAGTGENYLALTNVHWSNAIDGPGFVEVVVNSRNIL